MKQVREINSRLNAKIKQVFARDNSPTRPSTPTAPSSSWGATSSALEQTLSYLSPEYAGPLVPASIPVPMANQGEPTGLTAEQAFSHTSLVHAGALAASLIGGPFSEPKNSRSTVTEPNTVLLSHEPVQTQAPAQPSPQTSNLEATATPAAGTDKSLVSSERGISSWIKSEGWANLKGCLDNLNQAATVSGLGPLKTVIEGLTDCIGIYESKDAAHGRQAYIKVRAELESIFQELNQYLALSPTVVTNVSDVCGLIQKEIDYVKAHQARPKVRAEKDEDNVLACYKRMEKHLQALSRKLGISTLAIVEQNAMDDRLRDLAPARSACYDSGNDLKVKRGPCTKGTRINVLDQMYQWTSSRDSGNIYWMSGMAGTGKTTIAYSLCERLDTNPINRLGASFFCSRSLPECGNVRNIIPSIAFQLSHRCQPFQRALCEALKRYPDAPNKTPGLQFQTLLVGPLSDPEVRVALPTGTVILVDALDECEDETSTRQILDILLASSEGLPIKFVISSRPEATIRDRMEKNDRRLVLHELDKKEVQSDIKTYLREGLARMSPSKSEIEKLSERAGVLFIYAATVIRYVGYDDFGRNPRVRLNAVLDISEKQGTAQTKEIDQLYGAILEAAISDRKLEPAERADMRLILHTVVCAKAPLTIDALNQLLKLNDIDRVHAALRPLWSVLHVMGPKMTVTTLHASFPDYLTDSKRSGNTPWHCVTAEHHEFLAQKSFERICDTIPQFNICGLESSYLYDDEVEDLEERVEKYIPLELRYACQYWSTHLESSDSRLLSLLEQFFTKHLLLWMEVMNLTKNTATTPDILTNTKKWAAKQGGTRELIELIQDAWRFAQTVVSSPVSQSTPHIYISMLPFLPSHSPILKHYAHRMHGMIGVEGTALDRRKPLLARWSFRKSVCAACSADGTLVAIVPAHLADHIYIIDTSSGQEVRDLSYNDEGAPHIRHMDASSDREVEHFKLLLKSVDPISCVAFSPDGTRVASCTSRGALCVWGIGSGQPVFQRSPESHLYSIESMIFSHNGAYVICGSWDYTIRVWDAYSGQMVSRPFVGHSGSVTAISVSLDGTKIISGSADGTVRVWEMQTGRLVFVLIVDTNNVRSVTFSPNHSFIVCCHGEKVQVWDSQTGQSLLPPFSHESSVFSIAISPDSTYIAAGLDTGTIQIWNLTSGQAVSELFTGGWLRVDTLAYSSDGTRIISYSDGEGILCLIDAQSALTPPSSLPSHTEPILSFDISSNGERIASGSQDMVICVWNVVTGQLVLGPLTGHTGCVHLVRYSPVGNRLLSCSSDKTLRQWDAQTGDCVEVDNPIVDRRSFVLAAYSPEGNHIATISRNGVVHLWSSRTGERILGPMEGEREGLSIRFSTDGATLLTGWRNGAVRIWDVQSGQLVSSCGSEYRLSLRAFVFSPDGLHNVVAGSSYVQASTTMYQRVTKTGERITWSFKGDTDDISSIQFSHDGSCIVAGSDDSTVHIWDTQTGHSILGPLKGHTGNVASVAYSPDGTYVASASRDKSIRIWDVSTQSASSPLIDWLLDDDGWVVDNQFWRLIWVPVDLRNLLMSPRNTALLSPDGYVRLSFDFAVIGEGWAGCWLDG
ncbi:unnamed protein product [Rhizoctonia solani]|nr:unnamed protein product [Rhizoctonia solani]